MTQNWNDKIRKQLNNLPGFPPVPTGSPVGTPATPYEWILGDWIDECHVRPEVADFAALPATGNEDGDVRMSRADESWFIWDAAFSIWKPVGVSGGGVASVTGIAPINVTPGGNPVVSHDASGVVAGTYGDASNSARVTVDAKGHVTSATTVPISITAPISSFVLGTGPIQTISANTDQITPVALLHRIQTNGVNHTLTSTPQINLPGAVLGQVQIILNVDTTGRHVTLQRGVAEKLSMSNATKKIDPGGTFTFVFDGNLWVEVTHTESTNT
jgi:hypothetical protein